MSRWAREHPEEMEAISRLPASEQNAAERAAVAEYDARIRDAQAIARLEGLTRGDDLYGADAHLEADYDDRQNRGE